MADLKMPQINRWELCGNLVRDAETKFFPNKLQMTEFTVAATKGFGDKKKTPYVRCQAWGKAAEKCEKFKKGEPVLVFGEYDRQQFEDKQGVKREASRLVINSAWDVHPLSWPSDKVEPDGPDEGDIPF